jgi:hypothetical protein
MEVFILLDGLTEGGEKLWPKYVLVKMNPWTVPSGVLKEPARKQGLWPKPGGMNIMKNQAFEGKKRLKQPGEEINTAFKG